MKSKEAVDYLKEILIERVYFTNVQLWNGILDGKAKSARTLELSEQLSKLTPEQITTIKDAVPEITQTAIHYFLWSIDDGYLDLIFSKDSENAISLKENSDGLAGHFAGWIDDLSENGKG